MGFAELYLIALIVAINVKQETITSSFADTPATFSEICKAEVPLIVAIEYLEPVYLDIFFSNKSTNFPEVETQPSSIHFFIN